MTKDLEPFGKSPYHHLKGEMSALEESLMDWTNNVQQHPPATPEEAEAAWDEAHAFAMEIEDLAQALTISASNREREVLGIIDGLEER